MGQKVHPNGFRLGIYQDWNARWFARKGYGAEFLEDVKIRKFLKTRINDSDVSRIVLEKTGEHLRIVIHTSRPGMIIGKKG